MLSQPRGAQGGMKQEVFWNRDGVPSKNKEPWVSTAMEAVLLRNHPFHFLKEGLPMGHGPNGLGQAGQ